MFEFFVIIIVIGLGIYSFMKLERFGRLSRGESLARIKASRYYDGKSFANISPTPQLSEGVSGWAVLYEFMFKKNVRKRPAQALPVIKTSLKDLPADNNCLVWFGHSSYYMQVDGQKILVDPVFSGSASPVSFTTRSFAGTEIFSPEDFPEIDILFISHDHWDHLDYKTVKALKPKVKQIICGLGVAEHLLRWGFEASGIIEKDWGEEIILDNGFQINTTSGRHFSGRGLKRNQSLWMSYVLTTPTKKIFIGGDSGYDKHFKEIGDQFGPFDWAILECGQYDKSWKYIHMHPEQVTQAAVDLKAKILLPVHWAKFTLANHDWDAPIKAVSAYAKEKELNIKTPMIGEVLDLDRIDQQTKAWWQGLD